MIFLKSMFSVLLTFYVSFIQVTARSSDRSVLLSNVESLTLRKDLKTAHRRVSAVAQLKCIGGNAKGLYDVDVMRCTNQGSGYDDESIQWTCTASLPDEFKLGSTDVICEGYDSSTDPYILKGSCGVEYRLMLTYKGEEKYGRGKDTMNNLRSPNINANTNGAALIFWVIFLGVVIWMLYSACIRNSSGDARSGPSTNTLGWGGGGGDGPDGGDDDPPPPPYDFRTKPSTSQSGAWSPGFWSGAAAGAAGTAAGYTARDWREQRRREQERARGIFGGTQWRNEDTTDEPSFGSSRLTRNDTSRAQSSGPGSSYSSTRHESTGFGTTSRR